MVIKPVMFSEVDTFMENDDTCKLSHSDLVATDTEFRCLDFGITLKERANAKGIRCAVVGIHMEHPFYGDLMDGDHVWVAFETLDRGIVYYDPQVHNERIDEPKIGSNLQLLMYEAAERKDPTYDRYKDNGMDKSFIDAHIITNVMMIW